MPRCRWRFPHSTRRPAIECTRQAEWLQGFTSMSLVRSSLQSLPKDHSQYQYRPVPDSYSESQLITHVLRLPPRVCLSANSKPFQLVTKESLWRSIANRMAKRTQIQTTRRVATPMKPETSSVLSFATPTRYLCDAVYISRWTMGPPPTPVDFLNVWHAKPSRPFKDVNVS